MKDIDFMQLIEETNSNMGYYLAYISVVYTLLFGRFELDDQEFGAGWHLHR